MSASLFRMPTQNGFEPPEPAIRAGLFSVERLEQHAESSTAAQHIAPNLGRSRLNTERLYDNTRVDTATYRAIVLVTSTHQPIMPAAEWLLDNLDVVADQIREIKDVFAPGHYRMLPKLSDGPLQSYPRVFGVAWALVAHTDGATEQGAGK